MASASSTSTENLRSNRLGVVGIVFFVVAAAAPLVGMTGAVPIAIVLGNGAAAPGAYLAIGLTLLIFSVGYAAMSHRVTNTGAFFAYIGRGLGVNSGIASAFVSLLAYVAIQLAIYGFFGAVMAGQMKAKFGIDLPWWMWCLIAWALVLALSLLSVDIGAKLLGVLMLLELASLFTTAIAVLVKGGPEGLDLGASFSPGNIFAGGLGGTAGIALAFAFASFIGFEATAIYGEESRDPKRAVPRATYTAITLITVLFAITSLAMVTGLGTTKVVDQTLALSTVDNAPLVDPANVLFTVATQYVGSWLATLMGWLVLSSLFAGLLAFQNSAARYLFALGRANVIPDVMRSTNRRGAPLAGASVVSGITLVVMAIFAGRNMDPVLTMFYWFSGVAVVAIALVEILVCFAVIRYFRRTREDSRLWNTVIAPVIAAIGLFFGEYLLMSRFGLLSNEVAEGVDPTKQAWGLNGLGWFLVFLPFIVLVLGWLAGLMSKSRRNEQLTRDLVS